MTYHPFERLEAPRPTRWLLTCDHAANTVPPFVNGGDLGLPASDMSRHIAYDVGAAGVTRRLATALGAHAVLSNFSRLVIDPNRGEDDPTLLMKLYDGSIIPANRHAGPEDLSARKTACYDPYHQAVEDLANRQDDPVIVSIHSFTRQLRGRAPRPWQIGILYAEDDRLAGEFIGQLRNDRPLAELIRSACGEPLCVGANEPYPGYLPGDAIDRHATAHGRMNVLIEIRNDLIQHEDGQRAWASLLAPLLERALAAAQMKENEETD
ncbi:N-formylglutamate amidohydrolase [Poseidonocella pacifica]|nr:N-formylglutamate amidohydrolase [Poseidonocella pacifica]